MIPSYIPTTSIGLNISIIVMLIIQVMYLKHMLIYFKSYVIDNFEVIEKSKSKYLSNEAVI